MYRHAWINTASKYEKKSVTVTDLKTFRFSLPLPPSANALTSQPRGLRYRIKTEAYRKWKKAALLSLLFIKRELPKFAPKTKWKIMLTVHFKDWRSDLDNRIKPTVDVICETFGIDDRYCVRIYASKEVGSEERVSVILRILDK